ncbi:MAG: hypothetical protein NTY77_18495 [Elusimicrobia bacterium]|nr:hypothetical protein [Elusimicrobiota bacterium]
MRLLLSALVLAFAVSPLRAQVPELSQISAVQGFMEFAPAAIPSSPEAAYAGQAYTLAAATPAQAPQLPSAFSIKERIISFTDTFDVVSDGKKLGVITQKILSLSRSFKYKDADGNLVAEARSRIFSWGAHVDVTDNLGNPIGGFKEQVFKSFFKVYTAYSILDAQGKEVALSEKVDWLGTKVEITDPQGRRVATLERPWINFFSDHWDVKVYQPNAVDSRVMIMIAAYKTSVDNARRREARDKESDSKKKD